MLGEQEWKIREDKLGDLFVVRLGSNGNGLDNRGSREGRENWAGVEYILKVEPVGFAA